MLIILYWDFLFDLIDRNVLAELNTEMTLNCSCVLRVCAFFAVLWWFFFSLFFSFYILVLMCLCFVCVTNTFTVSLSVYRCFICCHSLANKDSYIQYGMERPRLTGYRKISTRHHHRHNFIAVISYDCCELYWILPASF